MPTTMRSDSHESDGTVITERRYGCYSWGILISLLLLALVIIVSVVLLVESEDAGVLLGVLLGLLLAAGIAAGVFLHYRRRRAMEGRDRGATEWVHRTYSQNQLATTPVNDASAPRSTSWKKWTPWKSTTSVHSASTVSSPVQYDVATPSAPHYV